MRAISIIILVARIASCIWVIAAVALGTVVNAQEIVDGRVSGVEQLDVVRPIHWERFQSKPNAELEMAQQILLNATRYNLKWMVSAFSKSTDAEATRSHYVIALPDNARRHEHAVRPGCVCVFSFAVALRTCPWDEARMGMSHQKCVEECVLMIRGLSRTHKANRSDGKGWGDHWQSAMWASLFCQGAWMIWDDVDPVTRQQVINVLRHEANRFIAEGYMVPVWATADRVLTPGDTKAEENAWDSRILQVAVAMFPEADENDRWRMMATKMMAQAGAMKGDLNDHDTIIEGRPLAEWLRGYNVRDDGFVDNHHQIHPDYSMFVCNLAKTYLVQSLAEQPAPAVADYGSRRVFQALMTKDWPSPPNQAPGGTVLKSDQVMIYYPEGTDWSHYRFGEYFMLESYAHYLGWDQVENNDPPEVATDDGYTALAGLRRRGAKCLEMQARHEDGKFYEPGEFDRYPGAEQAVLGFVADACLFHWVVACDKLQPRGNWLEPSLRR